MPKQPSDKISIIHGLVQRIPVLNASRASIQTRFIPDLSNNGTLPSNLLWPPFESGDPHPSFQNEDLDQNLLLRTLDHPSSSARVLLVCLPEPCEQID
jgi:hypothetical protein